MANSLGGDFDNMVVVGWEPQLTGEDGKGSMA